MNLAKHGMAFAEVEDVLLDPHCLVLRDAAHSIDEDRFWAIGMTRAGRLLFVVLAVTSGGIIRVISARRPTRRERHAYEARR